MNYFNIVGVFNPHLKMKYFNVMEVLNPHLNLLHPIPTLLERQSFCNQHTYTTLYMAHHAVDMSNVLVVDFSQLVFLHEQCVSSSKLLGAGGRSPQSIANSPSTIFHPCPFGLGHCGNCSRHFK